MQTEIRFTAAALSFDVAGEGFQNPQIIDRSLPYAVIADYKRPASWNFDGRETIELPTTVRLRRVQLARGSDGELWWQVPDGAGTEGCHWTPEEYDRLLDR
jgi:hypothetical protein